MTKVIQFRPAKKLEAREYWHNETTQEPLEAFYVTTPEECGSTYDFENAYPRDFILGESEGRYVDLLHIHLPNIAYGICLAMEFSGNAEHVKELQDIFNNLIARGAVGMQGKFLPNHLRGYIIRFLDPFPEMILKNGEVNPKKVESASAAFFNKYKSGMVLADEIESMYAK